jgi:predicted RNA-binding protein with TRAM domain
MDVAAALLCDFAQVRDRVLFVVAGGVTRLWRQDLPAPMGVFLALVVEQDPLEIGEVHQLRVVVLDQDGEQLAEVVGGFQVEVADVEPGDTVAVPAAVDLRAVSLPAHGPYDVRVFVDGRHHRTVRFRVTPRPATP